MKMTTEEVKQIVNNFTDTDNKELNRVVNDIKEEVSKIISA